MELIIDQNTTTLIPSQLIEKTGKETMNMLQSNKHASNQRTTASYSLKPQMFRASNSFYECMPAN